MISVLLADDQALVRGGFRLILEAEPDIDVIAEAADGAQAIEKALQSRPDVVLMDIRMPALDPREHPPADRAVRTATGSGSGARHADPSRA